MPTEALYGVIAFLAGLVIALIKQAWEKKEKADSQQDATTGKIFAKLDELKDMLHGMETKWQGEASVVRESVIRLQARLESICPRFSGKGKCDHE